MAGCIKDLFIYRYDRAVEELENPLTGIILSHRPVSAAGLPRQPPGLPGLYRGRPGCQAQLSPSPDWPSPENRTQPGP